MALIKLTPEELRASATKYSTGETTITDLANTLNQEESNLQGYWSGQGEAAFDAQFQELLPKVKQFAELLGQMSTQMNQVASVYEETDAQVASKIGY